MTEARIALITGANRGIGFEILKSLAVVGYTVIGTSRSQEGKDIIDKELAASNSKGFGSILDVKDKDSIKELNKQIKEKHGTVSVLINNAGITKDQLFLRMKDEDWDNVLATNLTGTFNITKVFIKNMIKNRYGRIINISSVSGLMGNPGQVNYSSAKAGLGGFTKSLAKEIGSRGITVNSIAPGFIETDMTAFLTEEAKSILVKDIPLQRMGDVKDVSDLVVFLASKDASYITGQTISVDGGLFMY